MTDFRALCAELIEIIEEHCNPDEYSLLDVVNVLNRARAALAAEPQGPSDEDLDALFTEVDQSGESESWRTYARAALARWGRPAIEPVPVSERLPGPEDCDAEGRCWTGSNDFIDETGDRPVPYPASWELRWILNEDTHWLPHWALPVPGVEGKP